MRTVTYNYETYWGYANASVPCKACGSISKRKVREYCTVNPFNKNEDGSVKTPFQVLQNAQSAAIRSAARQVIESRICRKCET